MRFNKQIKASLLVFALIIMGGVANIALAFEKENYFGVRIQDSQQKNSEWKQSAPTLPENWLSLYVEPKLKMHVMYVKGGNSAGYKWDYKSDPLFKSDNFMGSPITDTFFDHYRNTFKQGENFDVIFKLGEYNLIDGCSFNTANYWEISLPVTYLYENNSKAKSSEQTIYALITDAPVRGSKVGEKRIESWNSTPNSFCKNKKTYEINEKLIDKWLEEDIFNDFTLDHIGFTVNSADPSISFDKTVLPSMYFAQTFQSKHEKGVQWTNATIQKNGKASIVKTCHDYGLDYWEVKSPILYKFTASGEKGEIPADIFLGVYKKQEKDNTPYGLMIAAWSPEDVKYCEHIEKVRTGKPVTSPEEDQDIQDWVKQNLPDGFSVYLSKPSLNTSDDVLYIPNNIFKGKSATPIAANFLKAEMISFLTHATAEISPSWYQSLFKWKTDIEGTVNLADKPSFSTSCIQESKTSKVYTWDMQWPITVSIKGKKLEYKQWIHVKRMEKNSSLEKTAFFSFSSEPKRVCARENIEKSLKIQQNQAAFRKLLNRGK